MVPRYVVSRSGTEGRSENSHPSKSLPPAPPPPIEPPLPYIKGTKSKKGGVMAVESR